MMNHRDTESTEIGRDPLSERVIGAAIEVHRALGPGLLESAYVACLRHELSLCGLRHRAEVAVPLKYKGIDVECGYRLDLLVENELVVEVKSVEALLPIHEAQLLTYMRLLSVGTGLLLNFRVPVLKAGIRRFKL